MTTETKPSVLWIQTDEQRPDSLGCYGSRWAKTPRIDALAASGTVMHNAVCQSPACVPSRCSQITARYPHEIGIVNNSALGSGRCYPVGVTPFPAVFEGAGYTTVQIGKDHTMASPWGRAVSLDQKFSPYCDARGLTSNYDEADYRVVHRPDERALILAGTYPGGEDNPDRHKTDACLQFLRGVRKGDAPFMLHLSYIWPHTPVLAPSPWESTYREGEIPVKHYDRSMYETRSQCDRAMADIHHMEKLSRAQIDQMWRDYMGCVAYVDSLVGAVLGCLEETGLRESTIVLYSSDHGKMLGEWGSGEKCVFDSEVWRVPFIWSWPGRIPEGKRDTSVCELVDTAKTLMHLAGIPELIPPDYRGRNLFSGPSAQAVFGVQRQDVSDNPDFPPDLMQVAVRTEQFRMDLRWGIDGSEPSLDRMDGNLFDLEEDPHERKNLFEEKECRNVVGSLCGTIASWLEAIPVDPRLRAEELQGRMY